MDLKDIKVSDIENVLGNKEAIEFIRNTNPQFKEMSDEMIIKLISSVGSRLNEFKDKFGDIDAQSIIEMGKKDER